MFAPGDTTSLTLLHPWLKIKHLCNPSHPKDRPRDLSEDNTMTPQGNLRGNWFLQLIKFVCTNLPLVGFELSGTTQKVNNGARTSRF